MWLSLMLTFFMTIVNSAVNQGFAQFPHPSGQFSLSAFPWLLTTDSEVTTIRVISTAGLLVWCVGFLSLVSFILYKLPSQANNILFRFGTATLLGAFKGNCVWWVFAVLGSNVMIVLSLSLATNGNVQWALVTAVILVYTVTLASFKPLLFPLAYYSELFVNVGKLLMLVTGGPMATTSGGRAVNFAIIMITYAIAILAFLTSLIVLMVKSGPYRCDPKKIAQNLGNRATAWLPTCDVDFDKVGEAPTASDAPNPPSDKAAELELEFSV